MEQELSSGTRIKQLASADGTFLSSPFPNTHSLCAMQMKLLLILLIFILFVSCKQQAPKSFKVIVSDTSLTHLEFNELDFSKSYSRLLHLPDIGHGADSFEIRVWYWGFVGGKLLVDLRFTKDRWVGYKTQYFSSGFGLDESLDSSYTKSLSIPKNIDSIVAYFTSDSILNLPSQQAIPNFKDNIGDGQGCRVEIATKSFYKALYYHCPEHFTDRYSRKFLEALLFLDKYFAFYNPWCKPNP